MSAEQLKLALDELRMQMLGAQVLFGFQFQGLFQDAFQAPLTAWRLASCVGLASLLGTIALLIAVPSVHRLAERGDATALMDRVASRYAETALGLFALALSSNVYLVASVHGSAATAITWSVAALVSCTFAWFVLGRLSRERGRALRSETMTSANSSTPLELKIDYMLTEARVILPGAQAMLGFDFIVTLTRSFAALPAHAQVVHFVALGCVLLAVVLLIAPASVHRLAFDGATSERFLAVGSTLVTVALLPLAAGIAADMYVAVYKLFDTLRWGVVASGITLLFLFALWFALPLRMRGS